jgi:ABC-type dipeptide/oligopeptide/nickel transport system permease subunit
MQANNATSLQQQTWKKLKSNKAAMLGLFIIITSIFAAIFAYVIAPDNTAYANTMIVEIGGAKPGHHQLFLQSKKTATSSVSFFESIFFGTPALYTYTPVNSWKKINNNVIIEKYIDEGVYDTLVMNAASLAVPLSNNFVEKFFLFGTDKYGRDIASRLITGVRISLGVGLIAVAISLTLGILLGALAGFYRGRADDIIMWLINVIWSIPTLLLVFAITLVLGKGYWQVFVAVGLTMWVSVARLVRGQVMGVRELEYVEAGRALGFSNTRIIFRHILPNILGPILVVAASNFASAIVIEAGLSFLGVGVQPPQPSWGLMIKENYNFIITHNPMLALAPGFAIMLLVLAFNLLGNGLRDVLNVRA